MLKEGNAERAKLRYAAAVSFNRGGVRDREG